MANPNRIYARIPKRSPIDIVVCTSLTHAMQVAQQKRAEGFDAKATQLKVGKRGGKGRAFHCYVYEKLARVEG